MRIRAIAVAAALVAPAAARGQDIAQVGDQVPISAHGGWVAWSAQVRGTYRVFAWHNGLTRELLVKAQTRPFDVHVGTDSHGRAVATFSRCARYSSVKVYAARLVGVRCRLRMVDLIAGHERSAGVPVAPGTSDTLPAMWHGRVAFARRDPRHHRYVDQVMLWTPSDRTLRSLPHGAVPATCPFRSPRDCSFAPPSGQVLGLDLGARLLAFSWRVDAPAVIGHGGYEVRVDRLADGRTALVGSGYIGEACTGGIDGTSPAMPSVQGQDVWYSQTATDCYRVTARLNAYRGFPVRGRRAVLQGIVLQAAKDGRSLYALVAPPNAPNEGPRCTPCSITRLPVPKLQPLRGRPHSPFG